MRTRCGRASLATRQRSTSGSSRLIVGRDRLVAHGRQAGQGLEGAGGGEHVAGEALGRGDGNPVGVVAQDEPEHGRLGGVADRRARGVGIDVVDVAGLDARVGQGPAHGGGRRRGSGLGITW